MIQLRITPGIRNRLGICLGMLAVAFLPATSLAQETQDRTVLKVCADGNNMPFSNRDKEGFENKIAELFGESLGLPVEYTFFPQRMGFIRNTLRDQIKIGEYRCDLVIGVPEKFELAATTKPYYRSTYVLTYVKGRGFDEIKEPEDIDKLSEEQVDELRFGMFDVGPGPMWMKKHDLLHKGIPYQGQPGSTTKSVGDIMQDLVDDEIDMTIIWGPFAGWWAEKTDDVEIAVIPIMNDPDDPEMRMEFNMSMAVRYGEDEWKQQVEELIDKHQDEINDILEDYGVPLLDVDQEI